MKAFRIIIFIVLLSSCHHKKTNKTTEENQIVAKGQAAITEVSQEDSLKIQNLIRNVYEWNEKNSRSYFNIGVENEAKEKYISINWSIYEEIANSLRDAGYFSELFIDNYKQTLLHIQDKLDNGAYENGWCVGYLPPFGTGANEWCHCQDTPIDKYWKTMEIFSITPKVESVRIVWNWGKDIDWSWLNDEKNGYPLEVVNESGIWKISQMDGFDKKYY